MTATYSHSRVGTCPGPAASSTLPDVARVLVVEDEREIAKVVRDYLVAAGYEVAVVGDGDAALAQARAQPPDLVILDLGLPGRDGLSVATELRRSSPVPIVMLTARGEETDRIVGLELGADDYVVKPFSPRELVARVKAVLRGRELERIRRGRDPRDRRRHDRRAAHARDPWRGRAVDLTATEFQLVTALARQPGRVFTRGQLLQALRGVAFESYERAIDAHVKNVRRKLEPDPRSPRYLLTVHGVGYRWADA